MEKEENQNSPSKNQNQDTVNKNEKPEENLAEENKQETDQEPREEVKEQTPEEKIAELEDKVARTFAEMENQRRRFEKEKEDACLLYTSPSPRDKRQSRMPSSA